MTILVVLALAGCNQLSATSEQDTGKITARMLLAPDALAGPGPTSLNWSPVGARLAYVEFVDGQDMLWLYEAATGAK